MTFENPLPILKSGRGSSQEPTVVEIDAGREASGAPAGSRQERRRRRTREALYRAALRLFEERGFEATTVQAITDAADAGKGTFFHHFPTKDHVLVAYWDAFNARLLDQLERVRKRTARGRLLEAVRIFGEAAEAEPALGRVLLGRVFTSPALMHSDRENESRLEAWLEGVLREGIYRGELDGDADFASFRHLFLANLSSTFRDYILFGGESPTRLMTRRTELLLSAVEATS